MRRWLVLFLAVLLPLQFAWSAASGYCQHETDSAQSAHFGHHVHVHKGEAKKTGDSKFGADSDCAACHATGAFFLASKPSTPAISALVAAMPSWAMPPFTSALARAP